MNFTEIKKSLKRFLINRRISRMAKFWDRKTENFDNSLKQKKISSQEKKKYNIQWRFPQLNKINTKYLELCLNFENLHSPNYVPESVYYSIIEPILNNMSLNKAYSDKNFYDLFYDRSLFPDTLLRCIDGVLMDEDYNKLDILNLENLNFETIIVKPSLDSGGGKDVEFFKKEENKYINNEIVLDSFFLKKYNGDFIIQNNLSQHPFFSQFHINSINTLRVFTYRSVITNKISILGIVLRVGTQGKNIDNSRAGGYSIGIDKNGNLNQFALDKNGHKYKTVNNLNLDDNQFTIPFFKEIVKTSENIAKKNIHDRLLGLDIMIDHNGRVKCLEINNSRIEINFHQFNNGPLFSDFTDEILNYCRNNQKKLYREYVFD